ncbi:MAG: ABC transporter substrate-binding protein [Gammaproteobacteria bacterium]|nr:ABC transporter substrate-binding protein [Gammaproteobacteria bacterium]
MKCKSLFYACLFLLVSGTAGAAEMGGPAATVERFHGKLLSVMQRAEELGYRGRYEELEPYINGCFDIPFITNVVLGRYRDQVSEAQKTEFTGLFGRSSSATYASRFDGYGGEEFVEISREPMKRGRVLIRTELRRPDGDPVSLDYLLHEKQGKWYIISVSADGVNDLSLKRAEYAAVIKEKGFNGLVKEILFKIAEMETDTE